MPRKSENEKLIMDILKEQGPLSPKKISELSGINHNTVRRMVQKMFKKGTLKKKGRGIYYIAE